MTKHRTPKDLILSSLVPHVCTRESCGHPPFPEHHKGCMELSSDVFIEATKMTERRYDGTPLAPD